MKVSRRNFLKYSGASASFMVLNGMNYDLFLLPKVKKNYKIQYAKEVTTICPYCAVGCGEIVSVEDGKVVNIEGDPDHPINRGTLCSKGSALYQLANNQHRVTSVKYRAPYSDRWEEKSWDWALNKIAERIKETRDKSFTRLNGKGDIVNRTTAIASVGSAAIDNEECWLLQKFMRALGLVYIEHQARICHSSTVAALAETFGRGAMTNHWNDIANSDCILIMGSNAAENHPVSFKYVTKAMENGAKLISVDPRFTRTSAKADIYAPLRSGTDIAFLGGMINYILQHKLYNEKYVKSYTNAAHLINKDFYFKDGIFSGYDHVKGKYDKDSWSYQTDNKGIPLRDETLRDEMTVFRLLEKHFSRYSLEMVSSVTGTPIDKLEKVYRTFSQTGKTGKAGTIMYAMGWTQHTVGTQNIRAMAIIQLLLGNIGVAGGGVNALRGESNVQGSTDHCLLFHILPGYLKVPRASDSSLDVYNKKYTPQTNDEHSANWWGNYAKYSVSFLKAMYGDNANSENQFCYHYLPKLDDSTDYSWISLFEDMYEGNIKGFFAWGMNPACSSSNAEKTRAAFAKLDWMVSVNLWETETAAFWKREGVKPSEIKTEIFMLPCAASMEKEGSITNSGRWSQWRYKAVEPPGSAKADSEIMHELFLKLRELYQKDGGEFPQPILSLKWDYGKKDKINIHAVAKEINGYDLKRGRLLSSFASLKSDGSTSSGNWLYCGSYTEEGNMAARRDNIDNSSIGLYANWAWCWPLNRRILYNRASVDENGQPFDKEHPVIKWVTDGNNGKGKWVGDVPDGGWPPMKFIKKTKFAYIMKPEGYARIFGMGRAEGPFPEHYEPLESPLSRNLFSAVRVNPAIKRWDKISAAMDYYAKSGGRKYPYVATTFRLSEHWQTGAMTRHQEWLVELQPEMFVEISKELAAELKIKNGETVIIESARSNIKAKAMVTARFKPFKVNGRIVHQVGMPWCFGFMGLATGDSANRLVPNIGDANTMIPESKAFLVNIRKEA